MRLSRNGLRSINPLNAAVWHPQRRHCRNIHKQPELFEDLRWRGLVADITRPEQLEAATEKRLTVYAGVDPTAPSLHVGHLVPLMCLLHFQLRNHRIIPLIGGATGLVGDPSGRSTERPMATPETIAHNVEQLTAGLTQFFERARTYADKRVIQMSEPPVLPPNVQNNLTWLKDLNLLEFLRTVGFHSRVNTMLARESVQARLASQQGISFTEFTYQLLQAYDFLMLYKKFGCTVQIGGSDQWGNIIAGIDLINRTNSAPGTAEDGIVEKGFGVTTPLLTTASGEKFGKSAGNAVSLNEADTSVYDFYQFFLRTADADAERYLRMLTLVAPDEIRDLIAKHECSPEARLAQKRLAEEVTELVHGADGVRRAKLATKLLYERDIADATIGDVLLALEGNPVMHLCDSSEVLDAPLVKLAAAYGLAASNSAARQLVSAKGLYLNNAPVSDVRQKLTAADFINGQVVFLRAGSQKQAVIGVHEPVQRG